MNDNININDSDIKPELTFKNLCFMYMKQLINFPYIEKDFDAITDYQFLCLVVKYLNKVIDNNNKQNESITNLYNAFLQLQTYMNNSVEELEDAFNTLNDYVRDYFANLDVQDEINNKLDQMLEDGVLTEIIQQFLQSTAIWCFDTVADMKQATNLIDGSYAKTLGYYAINDKGEATYKITDTASQTEYQEELSSGLYATLIIKDYATPEMFGAYGDNIHDDTTAFNNSLIYSKNVNITKNYLIDGQITLNDNNKLIGNKSSTIFKNNDNSIINATNKSNIICKDFNIYGNKDNSTNQNGLSLYECNNVIIDNLTIENVSGDGIIQETCFNTNISNITLKNIKMISFLSYQGDNTNFKDSYINGENGGFKYNCQFKSCINSTMENITIENGTEISCFISRESLSDNPESIIPINNIIKNIRCLNHGKDWIRPSSGTFCAIFVEGYNTTIENIIINNSYTGGFIARVNNSEINNISIDTYGLSTSAIGCQLYDGSDNNINNISIKNGIEKIGLRTNFNQSNYSNITIENCGNASSFYAMQLAASNSNFNNILLIFNLIDARGISFSYSSNTASNTRISNVDVIRNSDYNEYDIVSIPTTVEIETKNPLKANIRGSYLKRPFEYKNDVFTIYEIETLTQYSTISAEAGDTRVYAKSAIPTVLYEKAIYNGSEWKYINSLQ